MGALDKPGNRQGDETRRRVVRQQIGLPHQYLTTANLPIGGVAHDFDLNAVGSRHRGRPGFGIGQSPEPRLAQAANGLRPAKDLFHPFANRDAGPIPGVPRRPSVDGGTLRLLRHVRGYPLTAKIGHVLPGVVGFVRAQRGARFPNGAIFHQRMAHEAELGFIAIALSVKPGLLIVVEAWVSLPAFRP